MYLSKSMSLCDVINVRMHKNVYRSITCSVTRCWNDKQSDQSNNQSFSIHNPSWKNHHKGVIVPLGGPSPLPSLNKTLAVRGNRFVSFGSGGLTRQSHKRGVVVRY